MYIFNRRRQAKSERLLEALPAAVEIAKKVTDITGHEVHVWNSRFGAPVGTIMWSVRIDSQEELFKATEKITVDATYVDMAMALAEQYEGPAQDRLGRIISGTPTESPSKYVAVTEAVMAAGRYADAVEFGVGMQEYLASELGVSTMFGTSSYDNFGLVTWLMGCDTLAEIDAAADWTMTNTGYQDRVKSAQGLFLDGSGHRGLIERLS
jgi:hypothetical protein